MTPGTEELPTEMGARHTPGPWAWFGNAGSNSLYLATVNRGHRYVMGFKRWGMNSGQPQFQPEGRGLVDASKLLMFEVGNRSVRGVEEAKADSSVYRLDVRGIDCADARLITAAPDLLEPAPTAADILERYVEYIRTIPADDLERHPYLPQIEQTAQDLRAAIAKATGAA